MANAFVQRIQDNEDFGDTSFVLPALTVTAGSLLVLGVALAPTTLTISSVTDDKSNTWQIGKSKVAGTIDAIFGFYAENCAAGLTTITVTLSADPDRARAKVHEVSGVATSAALGQAAAQGQVAPGTGTDAVTSGAVTTTTDGEYVFGMTSDSNTQDTFSAGTGYTFGATDLGTADEYRVQAAAGSIAATFTTNQSFSDPTTMIMTFKAAGGGGGGTILPQMMQQH